MSAAKPAPLPQSGGEHPAPLRVIRNRDDLSFTHRDNEEAMMNWVVPHDPHAYWEPSIKIGHILFDEVEQLAAADELEAFYAIVTAISISPGWSTHGSGIETGFSEALAALAILGMRSLRAGADRYDFKAERERIWWGTGKAAKARKRKGGAA